MNFHVLGRQKDREEMQANRNKRALNSCMSPSQPNKQQAFSSNSRPIGRRLIQKDDDEDEDEDDEDDDDFKQPVKTPTLIRPPKQKKEVNPFRKPVSFSSKGLIMPKRGVSSSDNPNDFREPPRLVMKPRLNKANESESTKEKEKEKQSILNSLHAYQKQQDHDKDKVHCPYCSEILFPMHQSIKKALKEIERKDKQHKEREMKLLDTENEFNMIQPRFIPPEEKEAFCKLHHTELVIKPDGLKKGYPTQIDFKSIPDRMKNFDKELKDIICNKLKSDYRQIAEEAYRKEGVTKARSTLSIFSRFHWSLPGYYGPKGFAVMTNALSDMYLKNGYLSQHLVSPQLPLEFIQQVLVPEAGFRLIRQDFIIKSKTVPSDCTTKAKQIMVDSSDYGSIVFPLD